MSLPRVLNEGLRLGRCVCGIVCVRLCVRLRVLLDVRGYVRVRAQEHFFLRTRLGACFFGGYLVVCARMFFSVQRLGVHTFFPLPFFPSFTVCGVAALLRLCKAPDHGAAF